jgi:hypothetical protein
MIFSFDASETRNTRLPNSALTLALSISPEANYRHENSPFYNAETTLIPRIKVEVVCEEAQIITIIYCLTPIPLL